MILFFLFYLKMKMNSFNYNRTKTLDIGAKTDNKVFIKIPLESGCFWQKEYFQNDLIETVIKDFKAENHVDIPQDYFLDWNFKNKPLKMTDQIKTLLNQEIPTVCINQVIKKKPLKINNEDIIPDLVGKPFNDPFEVFLFTKEDKSLKIQTYDPTTVNNLHLNNYSPFSAYCNGNNHLFISGGEKKNGEIIDDFWEIDLKDQNIAEPVKIPKKKNHSMIFIPNNYVFIVGGNDKKTFYFNTENAEVCEWADLNKIRNEPALQRINNNLYCFDSINKGNNDIFSLEKTEINSNKPEWVLLTPKFDFPINNEQKLSQKFFGVSKDDEENIIFLGGNMDNDSSNNDEIFNYKYNTSLNAIEESKVPYRKYNFKEKTFLTYKKNIDYILPDFNKQHPEVVFFVKKNNKIEAIDYEPKFNSQLKSLKPPISDFKYDFNMPNVTIPDQITDFNNDPQNQIKTEQNIFNSNLKMNNEPSFQDLNYKNQVDNNDLKNDDINFNQKNIQINFKEPEIESNKEEVKISVKMDPDIVKSKEQIYLRSKDKNNSIENNNNEISIQTGNLNGIAQDANINIEKNIQTEDLQKNIPRIKLEKIITTENKIDGNNNTVDIIAPKLEDGNIKINKNIDSSMSGVISGINIPKNDNINAIKIDFTKDVDIKGTIFGINYNKNKKNSKQKENKNNINVNGNIPGIKTNETKINIQNPNTNINQNININLKEPKLNETNLNSNIGANGESLNLRQNNINYNISGSIPGKVINPPSANINKNNDLSGKKIENQKVDIPSGNIGINVAKQKIPDYNLYGNIPGTNNNKNLKNNNKNNNKSKNKQKEQIYLSGVIKGTKSNTQKTTNINKTNKIPDYNLYGNIPGTGKKNQNINISTNNINLNENKNINLTGTINGTKLNIPKVENPEANINLKGPKVNVNVPNLNISENIPEINSNIPINQKNINIKEETKINIPNYNNNINGILLEDKIKDPNNDLNGPNLEVNINGPKLDIKNNNNEVNLPKEININGNLNENANELNIPKVEMPNINSNINLKDVKIQESNEVVTFKGIDINNSNINIKTPNENVNLKGNKVPLNTSLSGTIHGIKTDKKKAQDVDIKGTIKGIKIIPPKIPNQSININVNNPNISTNNNISSPQIETNNINLKANVPKLNINSENSQNIIINPIKTELNNGNINMENQKINNIPEYNLYGNIPGTKALKNKSNKSKNPDFNLQGIIPSSKNDNKKNNINANYKLNSPDVQLSAYNNNSTVPNFTTKKFHGNINDLGCNNNDNYNEVKIPRKYLISQSQINSNTYINNNNINLNNNISNQTPIKYKDNTINLVVTNMQILPEKNLNLNLSNSQNIIQKSNNEYYPSNLENSQINYSYNINYTTSNLQKSNFDYNIINNLENKSELKIYNTNEQYNINGDDIHIEMPKDEIKYNNTITEIKNRKINNINDNDNNNYKLTDLRFRTIVENNQITNNVNFEDDKINSGIQSGSNRGNSKKKNKDLPLVGTKNNDFKTSKVEAVGNLNTENIDINNLKTTNVGINGMKTGDRIIQ